MANKKKQSREERLLKKRLAEKRRYERIKNNPNLWKEKQEKDKLRYIKRKQDKKQLSISEMTPRQKRMKRKQWRKNFNAYYLRKKQEKRTAQLLFNNTPPESPEAVIEHQPEELELPTSPSIYQQQINVNFDTNSVQFPKNSNVSLEINSNSNSPSVASTSNASQRRLRYKNNKKINNLKTQIHKLKKLNERYRKKIQRSEDNKAKKNILNTKQITTKYKNSAFKRKIKVRDFTRGISKEIKEDIVSFLEEDQHSLLCAGKKECIVKNKIKKQKRYLSDSLTNLHKKYIKEKNIQISYPTFCRLRPFWILSPDIRSRETCLCKLHTNVELIIQCLKKNKIITLPNSRALLQHMTCDSHNVMCLHRQCNNCKNKVVPFLEFDNSQDILYWQWVVKLNVRDTQKKIRVTEKTKLRKSPIEVIEVLNNLLEDFFIHCGNISGQYQAVQSLKQNLQPGHCIVHMDFSENYSVKCNEEIQSYHFGGSRKQITLHTVVIYFKDTESDDLKHKSFCTVSDCLRHDVSAVWAHIVPILDFIAENICPDIQSIHFLSDSPSSQYRNKKIFHVISSLHLYQRTLRTITWNYSESGHGKGAPDGIGATMKQAADRAVACGTDIKDVDDFLKAIHTTIHNVAIKTVSEYDIYEKDLLFAQKINNFPGCMKMHQIVWSFDSEVLAARKLSCSERCCLEDPILCPHGKHLGFYTVASSNPSVKPLAESTAEISMLRKEGISGSETVHQPKKSGLQIISNVLIKPGPSILAENLQPVPRVHIEDVKEVRPQQEVDMQENEPIKVESLNRMKKFFHFWDSDDDWEYPEFS